jgi:type II secretory pathway pseudopilin PulG
MKRFLGFTLAEVLITLGVIGVVSVIVLPTVMNNVRDRQYETARHKILNSLGEAGRFIAINGNLTSASDAEDFVNNYLSKKLKIVKTCDGSHLEECGLLTSKRIKIQNGTDYRQSLSKFRPGAPHMPSTSSWETIKNLPGYGFVTADGFSVILFYNPGCTTGKIEPDDNATGCVCFDAIYDMNGLKNPNQVGKDIGFVTVMYPDFTNRAVAPNFNVVIADGKYSWQEANQKCSEYGKEYTLPDRDELLAMAINIDISPIPRNQFWSSTTITYENKPSAYKVQFNEGYRNINKQTDKNSVLCIKR